MLLRVLLSQIFAKYTVDRIHQTSVDLRHVRLEFPVGMFSIESEFDDATVQFIDDSRVNVSLVKNEVRGVRIMDFDIEFGSNSIDVICSGSSYCICIDCTDN